jgi:hypothetical protein
MANLNLNTIALVSTLIPSPLNGAPSSLDYNDSQSGTLLDLTSITAFINNVLIPMLVALPDNALSGLEGSSIYGDSTDQTSLFYDSITGSPLALADSLRQLSAQVSTGQVSISNLAIQVGQLQQKLSSTNQNNIAITLQNLTNSLNNIVNQQTATNSSISSLQAFQQKQQTVRVNLSLPASTNASYSVDWPSPFADNNYTVSIVIQDPSFSAIYEGFTYLGTGTGLTVKVNNTTGSVLSVYAHAIGIHD